MSERLRVRRNGSHGSISDSFAFRSLRLLIRHRKPSHSQRGQLVSWRVEPPHQRHQAGNRPNLRWWNAINTTSGRGPFGKDFERADDLIFRFLDLDQFAEPGRLAGLAFANDSRMRLEHAPDRWLIAHALENNTATSACLARSQHSLACQGASGTLLLESRFYGCLVQRPH
jgi:hypothetical protein